MPWVDAIKRVKKLRYIRIRKVIGDKMNIGEILQDPKLDIHYLAKEKSDFFSKSFMFTWNEEQQQGKAKEKIFDVNFSYQSIIKKRKREEREVKHYATQMAKDTNGRVNINYVSVAAFVIGNFTLRNGAKKKLIICDSKLEEDPFFNHEPDNKAWMASHFSKCVNHSQIKDAKGYSNIPLYYSLFGKVSEKLLLWNKNEELVRIDFVDYPIFPVFGRMSSKNKIRANLAKNPWWLKTMDVEFFSKDGAPLDRANCVIDTRYNCLIAIYTIEIDIDLNEFTLTSSRKNIIGDFVYDEFRNEQGKESPFFLLPYENIFDNSVFKPDSNSESGLTRTRRPAFYSELFNTHYDDKKIAITNGFRCHPNAIKRN